MGQIKAKTYIEKLGFQDEDKKNQNHDRIQKWVYQNIDDVLQILPGKVNGEYPWRVTRPHWEFQIMNNKFLICFIDLAVVLTSKNPSEDDIDGLYYPIIGTVFIEVKSKIESLGALLRQMNTYRTYTAKGFGNKVFYIVVSPDDSHAKILNEQGIYFYHFKDPNLLF